MAGVVVSTREGDERGNGGGGGWERKDELRLNRASRFGQARAALSDGHAPTLYDQIKRKVRAPLGPINMRGVILCSPIFKCYISQYIDKIR